MRYGILSRMEWLEWLVVFINSYAAIDWQQQGVIMSQYTKQILFIVVGIFFIGLIGVWNETAQRLLGMFAVGWMLVDIARDVFPENK